MPSLPNYDNTEGGKVFRFGSCSFMFHQLVFLLGMKVSRSSLWVERAQT